MAVTSGWTCPTCGRFFGRRGQGHDCAPGLSVEEYFETGPAHERPVYDAIVGHLDTLGPYHADVVSVGIFFKNPDRFAEMRPMQRWVAVSFWLDRRAAHRTITRRINDYGGRFWHTANVASPDDVDDDLRHLLAEAYRSTAR
jgi:hypothetical protein